MSKGLEIRSQIDTEVVKGLLLINGGGAVALLAFLPNILKERAYTDLVLHSLWALPVFSLGLIFAVVHNRLRRVCSLKYEQQNYTPKRCGVFPFSLKVFNAAPCVCHISQVLMWLSVTMFILACSLVTVGGIKSVKAIEGTSMSDTSTVIQSPNKALNSTPQSGAN